MADISLPVFGGMFDSTTVVDTVNGFPRGDKAVDASFFAKMISSFYSDGILNGGEYAGNGFGITLSGGLTVTVAPGIAWIRGYMAWMQAAQSFTLSAGHVYTIVLRLNAASGELLWLLRIPIPARYRAAWVVWVVILPTICLCWVWMSRS